MLVAFLAFQFIKSVPCIYLNLSTTAFVNSHLKHHIIEMMAGALSNTSVLPFDILHLQAG